MDLNKKGIAKFKIILLVLFMALLAIGSYLLLSSKIKVLEMEDKKNAVEVKNVENEVKNTKNSQDETKATIEEFLPTEEWWKIIARSDGDLNADGLLDVAIVIEERGPLGKSDYNYQDYMNFFDYEGRFPKRSLLIIFKVSGGYKLSARSDNAIIEMYPGPIGEPLEDFLVDDNSLLFSFYSGGTLGTIEKYKFKYQNNDWYLIGEKRYDFDRLDLNLDRIMSPEIISGESFDIVEPPTKLSEFNIITHRR